MEMLSEKMIEYFDFIVTGIEVCIVLKEIVCCQILLGFIAIE